MNKLFSNFGLLLILTISLQASADELEDAAKYYGNKNYAQAHTIYSKLASAGNSIAQTALGEMYWYGDGVEANEKLAEQWFIKAANGGDSKAQAFVKLIAQRKNMSTEILYYTTHFDGKDIKGNCVKPTDFTVSIKKNEIKKTSEEYQQWVDCYNQFVGKLNQALPPGKNIPPRISELMNESEMTQASAQMDKVYSSLATEMQKTSLQLQTQYEQWKKVTEDAVISENKRIALDNQIRTDKGREFSGKTDFTPIRTDTKKR